MTCKKVWFCDTLWKVAFHIKPNKEQDFLLLCREHKEGTDYWDYVVADIHNDPVYPNTPKVRKIMKEKALNAEKNQVGEKALTPIWLDFVKKVGKEK